jgi:hypothetical protein
MTSEDAAKAQSEAFRLAGLALAHAAYSVEDGAELVPIAIVELSGVRNAMRFATEITQERLLELYAIVRDNVEPGSNGVLAFASVGRQQSGVSIAVLNVHILDDAGQLVGVLRQVYHPARSSRIPGRSTPFTVIGTPSPSPEIDIPGAREGIMFGVMSHPEGERLFPQLAAFAVDMVDEHRSASAAG